MGGAAIEDRPGQGPIAGELMWPAIRRVVAPNASASRANGTNAYVVNTPEGALVIDPGPSDHGHLEALLAASEGRVAGILITHGHLDHCELAAGLKAATRAPVYAFHRSDTLGPLTDVPLRDGDRVGPLEAIHTPGHAGDHLCFTLGNEVIFTGDQVMGWATTLVPSKTGSMIDYLESLHRLLARSANMLLPGHGEPVREPAVRIAELIERRQRREREIVAAIAVPRTVDELVAELYSRLDPAIPRRFAAENVLSHVIKLEIEGRARRQGELWRAA